MSNELTTYKSNQFMALDGEMDPELAEALESLDEIGVEFGPGDMTRVKFPTGGDLDWKIEHPDGTKEIVDSLDGVICFIQQYGVLWPSLTVQEGSKPVLRTLDMKVADEVGPVPEEMVDVIEPCFIGVTPEGVRQYDWTKLPYTEWGTGKEGRGKRVKEQRHVYLLREDDIVPLVVTIPPASLTVFRKFMQSVATRNKLPYYRSVVSLKLAKDTSASGEAYAKLNPSLKGSLSREDGAAIREKFTNHIAQNVAKDVVNDDLDEVEAS